MCHLLEMPSGTVNGDPRYYEAAAWTHVRLVLRELGLSATDVLIDYGCGAGRVLVEASRYRLRRVVGVEINEALAKAAEDNLQSMRGRRTPFEIHKQDATEFRPSGCSKVVLFNPFGKETMSAVLENLIAESSRSGTTIHVAYLNPQEQTVFEEYPEVTKERVLKWAAFRHPTNIYSISG